MNSKNKGNSFEREISKSLSLWLSEGERDDLFWRTSSSGGRATQRIKKGLNTLNSYGDICAVSSELQSFNDSFYVELKNYKKIDLWSFITKKGKIIDWWNKLHERASNQEKIPVLIIKTNNKPILFITDDSMRDRLIMFFDISPELSVKFKDNSRADKISSFHVYLLDKIMDLDPVAFRSLMDDIIGKYE